MAGLDHTQDKVQQKSQMNAGVVAESNAAACLEKRLLPVHFYSIPAMGNPSLLQAIIPQNRMLTICLLLYGAFICAYVCMCMRVYVCVCARVCVSVIIAE